MLTFTDIFCGAGGSSIGLAAAGFELATAANHWQTAIDTHQQNFPHARHICADLDHYDMRRLGRSDILWASPICTEATPAGGLTGWRRPRRHLDGQADLLDTLPDELRDDLGDHADQAMLRTRATFHDVIRATEVHGYRYVLVENVPEVIDRWRLFDWWLDGMVRLGYRFELVSVSSAHIGDLDNPWAPQWRDRLLIGFSREDMPHPDLTPRPIAPCRPCGADVFGVQTWCPAARRRRLRAGRYRRIPTSSYGRYWYTCPTCRRRVEPYVLPADTVIDWTDLGTPIPDLPRPLQPTTERRIRHGLHLLGPDDPGQADGAAEPHAAPLLRHGRAGAGPVPEAFIAMLRRNSTTTSVRQPLATLTAGGTHHALIVPYYSNATARTTGQPLDTVPTNDRFALVANPGQPAGRSSRRVMPRLEDCRYRMLKPRESLRAQRFPDTYTVTGKPGEQTMQAGNAVPANLAQWLGSRLMTALDTRDADPCTDPYAGRKAA